MTSSSFKDSEKILAQAKPDKILEEARAFEERSLFNNKGISSHFLIDELRKRGYPESSIKNMKNCGLDTGYYYIKSCDCSTGVAKGLYSCDLRTCQNCSKRRKKRLRDKFLPYMQSLANDRNSKCQLYFLTLSPPNYENYESGLKDIRTNFNKFKRRKYIEERIKGGMYVIEAKEKKETGWNVHIHAVIYGRRLDNRVRGKCLDCKQNLMKYDRLEKKYHCANKKCNSYNVTNIKNSKIVELFSKISGKNVMVDITKVGSGKSALNYMLKYVGANKDEFSTIESLAEYMVGSKKKRLINTFGCFFKAKIKTPKPKCWFCNKEIIYELDFEVSKEIEILKLLKKPPDFSLKRFV